METVVQGKMELCGVVLALSLPKAVQLVGTTADEAVGTALII
jgi:hypothetical protein